MTNTVTSRHTKAAYGCALRVFIAWYQEAGAPGLSKATVQTHVTALRAKGKTALSINQRLTPIRKFPRETADNGQIDESTLRANDFAIGSVRNRLMVDWRA